MTNREKYAKEILDIACNGDSIAMTMDDELVGCNESGIECDDCKFYCNFGGGNCEENIQEWANSEYIGRTTISESDRKFLDYLSDAVKWIVRDGNGLLCVYYDKPTKEGVFYWRCENNPPIYLSSELKINFPMVKREDKEPWLIEDLKMLEVK